MKRRKSNQDKRRKEQRKLERLNSTDFSFQSKWFIIFCVVIVFLMFYILTVYITNKNAKKNNNSSTTNTGEILLGRSFSMSDQDYLVLYYDSSNEEIADTCHSLFTNYRSTNGNSSIYYVDMNSGFNKSHVTAEESNKNPDTVENLSINGPTLIKISQNKAVEYVEGLEAIQGYLQ